jgi:hypothetical protein
MTLDSSKLSARKRDDATIELLKKLRDQLHSEKISNARRAAFNLSWKQEDGLAILSEALFGGYSRTTKKAAAYGLRSMKGRMAKLALEVHEKGLNHRDRTTKAVCIKSLSLMKGEGPEKGGVKGKGASGKMRIQEIARKNRARTKSRLINY